MGIGDWLGVLALKRAAIERALSTRGLLALGPVFVASAALAREYDAEFIPHNPIVLAVPFVASAAAAFLLFVVLWFAAARKGWPGNQPAPFAPGPEAPRASFWPMFGRFLGVFWLTAPMAWLYGVPFERMLPELAAAEANLWMLAFVATWRVAVMVRVAQVMFGFSLWQALVLVLFFSDLAVLGVVFFAPWPVMEIMGGVQGGAEQMLAVVRFFLGFFGVVGFFVLLAPFATAFAFPAGFPKLNTPPARMLTPQLGGLGPSLWAVAVSGLLAWAALLPFTQPPLEHSPKRLSLLAAADVRNQAACHVAGVTDRAAVSRQAPWHRA